MIKKTLFSVVFMSSVSLAFAQDVAKESKSSPVEKSQSFNNKIVVLKPIRVADQSTAVKGGEGKKGELPVTKPMQVKVAGKSTPIKGNTNKKR
jgi:hypothetical protein